ncbi:MAG: hypothetical protein F4Z11_00625 [Cenarchaeum sp. SB0666_bin_15]|nr:hypothetical protein [Cenarchaeum sp. SB0666_bin_15]MYJ27982.1 hypothetical protein [Cenarchaeum sp. SB0672_bin_9]
MTLSVSISGVCDGTSATSCSWGDTVKGWGSASASNSGTGAYDRTVRAFVQACELEYGEAKVSHYMYLTVNGESNTERDNDSTNDPGKKECTANEEMEIDSDGTDWSWNLDASGSASYRPIYNA